MTSPMGMGIGPYPTRSIPVRAAIRTYVMYLRTYKA